MQSERSSEDGRSSRVEEQTLRTCAVTRAERPISELIRFVAGPDGTIVPDLAARLPGRGAWVTATHEQVAAAVKAEAFARSLKRSVVAPPDLADQVEQLMVRRAGEALSIANKAAQVVAGFAKIETEIARGSVLALLHAREAAADGRDKLDRRLRAATSKYGKPANILGCLTIDEMSLALGRANVVHAGLLEGGAARRVLIEAERLMRYRSRFWPSAAAGATKPADVETDRA